MREHPLKFKSMDEKLEAIKHYLIEKSKHDGVLVSSFKADLKIHGINGTLITRSFLEIFAKRYFIDIKFAELRSQKKDHGFSYGKKNKCKCVVCKLSKSLYITSVTLNTRVPIKASTKKRKRLNIKTCDFLANNFRNIYETDRKRARKLIKQYLLDNNMYYED